MKTYANLYEKQEKQRAKQNKNPVSVNIKSVQKIKFAL